jgi:hypothetical protein
MINSFEEYNISKMIIILEVFKIIFNKQMKEAFVE